MTSVGPYNPTAITYKNLVREPVAVDGNSITGKLISNPDFTIFSRILHKSRMLYKLSDIQANFTLFATPDHAIKDKYDVKSLDDMDEGLAQEIILGSLLDNRIDAQLLKSSQMRFFATRRTAHKLLVSNYDKTMLNKSINVIAFDLKCNNGLIHTIDDIIFPTYKPMPI